MESAPVLINSRFCACAVKICPLIVYKSPTRQNYFLRTDVSVRSCTSCRQKGLGRWVVGYCLGPPFMHRWFCQWMSMWISVKEKGLSAGQCVINLCAFHLSCDRDPLLSGQGETYWEVIWEVRVFKPPLNLRIFLSCVFVEKYCLSCACIHEIQKFCTAKR